MEDSGPVFPPEWIGGQAWEIPPTLFREFASVEPGRVHRVFSGVLADGTHLAALTWPGGQIVARHGQRLELEELVDPTASAATREFWRTLVGLLVRAAGQAGAEWTRSKRDDVAR